jgi:hypothetical protein
MPQMSRELLRAIVACLPSSPEKFLAARACAGAKEEEIDGC